MIPVRIFSSEAVNSNGLHEENLTPTFRPTASLQHRGPNSSSRRKNRVGNHLSSHWKKRGFISSNVKEVECAWTSFSFKTESKSLSIGTLPRATKYQASTFFLSFIVYFARVLVKSSAEWLYANVI